MKGVVRDIPLAHVEWIAHYLTQLSTSQIEAAFRAADYSADESKTFAAAVQRRIDELLTIREGGPERVQRSARNSN